MKNKLVTIALGIAVIFWCIATDHSKDLNILNGFMIISKHLVILAAACPTIYCSLFFLMKSKLVTIALGIAVIFWCITTDTEELIILNDFMIISKDVIFIVAASSTIYCSFFYLDRLIMSKISKR